MGVFKGESISLFDLIAYLDTIKPFQNAANFVVQPLVAPAEKKDLEVVAPVSKNLIKSLNETVLGSCRTVYVLGILKTGVVNRRAASF